MPDNKDDNFFALNNLDDISGDYTHPNPKPHPGPGPSPEASPGSGRPEAIS
jgi:hypothetical protein